jgi:hypothetical protein
VDDEAGKAKPGSSSSESMDAGDTGNSNATSGWNDKKGERSPRAAATDGALRAPTEFPGSEEFERRISLEEKLERQPSPDEEEDRMTDGPSTPDCNAEETWGSLVSAGSEDEVRRMKIDKRRMNARKSLMVSAGNELLSSNGSKDKRFSRKRTSPREDFPQPCHSIAA